MAGIFYILIGGLVLALGVAFFEFLYWSRVDAKKHKVLHHCKIELMELDNKMFNYLFRFH